MEIVAEVWKPVVGYEGIYRVSDLGRVQSLDRIVNRKGHTSQPRRGIALKQRADRNGYIYVSLSSAGKRRFINVHCLVAEAFIGPRPTGLDINHKDGDKRNNSPANLEYVTEQQNIQHAYRTGLLVAARGEASGPAKLTECDVRKIRDMLKNGMSCKQIASNFGVSPSCIDWIKKGRNWSHVA